MAVTCVNSIIWMVGLINKSASNIKAISIILSWSVITNKKSVSMIFLRVHPSHFTRKSGGKCQYIKLYILVAVRGVGR